MTNAQLRKAIVTINQVVRIYDGIKPSPPPPHAIVKLLPFLLYLTGEIVLPLLSFKITNHNDIKTMQTGIKYFLMFQIKYLWSNKKSYEYNIVNIMDYTSKIILVCVRGRVVCKTELKTNQE